MQAGFYHHQQSSNRPNRSSKQPGSEDTTQGSSMLDRAEVQGAFASDERYPGRETHQASKEYDGLRR